MLLLLLFSVPISQSNLHYSCNLISLGLTKTELDLFMTSYDIKRLEMYSNNLVDYHLIMDLLPTLARFYFLNLMKTTSFSAVQSVSVLS